MPEGFNRASISLRVGPTVRWYMSDRQPLWGPACAGMTFGFYILIPLSKLWYDINPRMLTQNACRTRSAQVRKAYLFGNQWITTEGGIRLCLVSGRNIPVYGYRIGHSRPAWPGTVRDGRSTVFHVRVHLAVNRRGCRDSTGWALAGAKQTRTVSGEWFSMHFPTAGDR